MSCLLNKSEFNRVSAELLIDNNYYSSSVHCSYYSVFQRMKHEYKKVENIDDEEYREREGQNNRASSHMFLIDSFCSLVSDPYLKRNIKGKVKDLKTYRIKSDYQNIEVNYDASYKAFSICIEILDEIKRMRL